MIIGSIIEHLNDGYLVLHRSSGSVSILMPFSPHYSPAVRYPSLMATSANCIKLLEEVLALQGPFTIQIKIFQFESLEILIALFLSKSPQKLTFLLPVILAIVLPSASLASSALPTLGRTPYTVNEE